MPPSGWSCLSLFLLYLYLHAYTGTARRLYDVRQDPAAERSSQLSIQSNDREKLNLEKKVNSSIADPSSSSSSSKERVKSGTSKKAADSQEACRGQRKMKQKKGKITGSRVEKNKALVSSVSWRVPKENAELKQQYGLDSDYAAPKTHPPSNN